MRASIINSIGEYVRDGVSTNILEGYFSQLKRSIDGTHHQVSTVHLGRYLAQFDFMYSHCRAKDSTRMEILLGQVGVAASATSHSSLAPETCAEP